MLPLADRQADRVMRKVEHALMEQSDFDASRAGVGTVSRRAMPADEADAIDEATAAVIARHGTALGIEPVKIQPVAQPAFNHKVKLGGV